MHDLLKDVVNTTSPENQVALASLGDAGLAALMLALLERLPEQQAELLPTVAEQGGAEDLELFLRAYVPDLDLLIETTLAELQEKLR